MQGGLLRPEDREDKLTLEYGADHLPLVIRALCVCVCLHVHVGGGDNFKEEGIGLACVSSHVCLRLSSQTIDQIGKRVINSK